MEVLSSYCRIQVHSDLEALIILGVNVLEAYGEHLAGNFFLCPGQQAADCGDRLRGFFFRPERSGRVRFLRQVHAVHCADHGSMIVGGNFRNTGRSDSNIVNRAVLHSDRKCLLLFGFTQDANQPAILPFGEAEYPFVGNGD